MTQRLFALDIRLENDVVVARQKARTLAAALNFDLQDQARIATAVSELARNVYQYAGKGRVEFRVDGTPEKTLTIIFRDEGKGIPNLEEILDGKYVSSTGMGLGIVGAKRLMDTFQIESSPASGTTVTVGKRMPERSARLSAAELDGLLASVERATHSPYEELVQQNKELMNALQELRSRQEELDQLNRELDETNRGVVALYAELNDKADFLQRASELKSHFFSNMSHEFKTPLNSITALSRILLDRLDGPLTSEQEKQVTFISNAAQDLSELVNDLLDLARVDAGRVIIRPVDFHVASLFAALRGMLRPLVAQNSSVSLVIEDPAGVPELYSDEAKISQILRNFISNALKFTEHGEIRVSAERGHDDTVIFSVSDTGIGIAEEDQERIFEEWTQIEGTLQKTAKGSGLGLPLSKKFAQLLGGNVYVKSELGKGSTFFAAVPRRFTGPTETIYVPEAKRKLDSAKWPVLVVEDNKEALFIYDKYLKDSLFQMIPARSLKEARKALREFRPAAVVLDVLLQGEQSWELLEEIKRDPVTADVPVFVVTVVENRQKAMKLGADSFQVKPVERSWLLNELETVRTRCSETRVLVIDDDEVSRYLLKTLFGPVDCHVMEASSGEEGLQRAAGVRPNMIVLDLAMTGLSGFEVLKRLKDDARTAQIPVIIYTSASLNDRDRARLSDAVAILPKESRSRELSLERFTEAFKKAGVPLKLRTSREKQHV